MRLSASTITAPTCVLGSLLHVDTRRANSRKRISHFLVWSDIFIDYLAFFTNQSSYPDNLHAFKYALHDIQCWAIYISVQNAKKIRTLCLLTQDNEVEDHLRCLNVLATADTTEGSWHVDLCRLENGETPLNIAENNFPGVSTTRTRNHAELPKMSCASFTVAAQSRLADGRMTAQRQFVCLNIPLLIEGVSFSRERKFPAQIGNLSQVIH